MPLVRVTVPKIKPSFVRRKDAPYADGAHIAAFTPTPLLQLIILQSLQILYAYVWAVKSDFTMFFTSFSHNLYIILHMTGSNNRHTRGGWSNKKRIRRTPESPPRPLQKVFTEETSIAISGPLCSYPPPL